MELAMIRLFSLCVFALAATSAMAADEVVGALPNVKQGIVTGITAMVVFLIVLLVLGVKVWPPIVKALDERAAKIREEIAAAEAARRQAKDALEMYEKSLAEARAEAAKMLELARSQQQQLAAELRAQADTELTTLRERARRDIETAKRAAVAEIYGLAANAATTIAARVLQREITPRDQQRLVEETLGELQALQGASN
jgi:F-type H+-transporting ATPase subunit b